jgi:hypothetical protein
MAQDTRQRKFDFTLNDVQIGMTDATGGHSHQNLARSRLWRGNVFEP